VQRTDPDLGWLGRTRAITARAVAEQRKLSRPQRWMFFCLGLVATSAFGILVAWLSEHFGWLGVATLIIGPIVAINLFFAGGPYSDVGERRRLAARSGVAADFAFAAGAAVSPSSFTSLGAPGALALALLFGWLWTCVTPAMRLRHVGWLIFGMLGRRGAERMGYVFGVGIKIGLVIALAALGFLVWYGSVRQGWREVKNDGSSLRQRYGPNPAKNPDNS
jgi:hypothetical protein